MATRKDLVKLEGEIADLLRDERSKAYRIADLVCRAKREHFPKTTDWLVWMKERFNFSRRQSFTYAAVTNWLAEVDRIHDGLIHYIQHVPHVPVAHETLEEGEEVRRAALEMRRVDILTAIDPAQFPAFLAAHPLQDLDREELRDAVAAFLNRERRQTFTGYGRLPDPDQLLFGLDDPSHLAKIDYDLELRYVTAHMQRIAHVMDNVSTEKLLELRQHLLEDAQIIESRVAGVATAK